MRRPWLLVLLALPGCGGGGTTGPVLLPDGPKAAPGPVRPVEEEVRDLEPPPPFTLEAGDQFEIRVFRHAELTLTYRVPQSGGIRYPLLGEISVAGRTPSELERLIAEGLEKDFLSDPQVSVSVTHAVPRRVYVMGGVRQPRDYEIPPSGRLTATQAIGLAGGRTDEASRTEILIERFEGERCRRIVVPTPEAGEGEAGVFLRSGDVVIVPESSRAVYVLGAVGQPGTLRLPLAARLTVVWAISMSGGFTKFSASGRVQVTRSVAPGESRIFYVDVDAILDGHPELDVELQPGDIIFVPQRLF